jgi:tRNA(adenine34) deaminase
MIDDEERNAAPTQDNLRADAAVNVAAGAVANAGGCVASDTEADTATDTAAADERFMRAALAQARLAGEAGEVPIGAVVVGNGQIVAAARNTREESQDPAGHAEFTAIRQAARKLGAWRLTGCTVYVTLEPCVMCAGLMHQARIDRCVFGAYDPKAGALGTLYAINADERLNHVFPAQGGVLQDECAQLLKSFFARRREQRKQRKRQARAAAASKPSDVRCGCDSSQSVNSRTQASDEIAQHQEDE